MSCSCSDPAQRSCPECRDYEAQRRTDRYRQRVLSCGLPTPLRGLRLDPLLPTDPAARAGWDWGSGAFNGLCFRGPVGVGKTWMAAASMWKRLRMDPILYVPVPTLMTELRSGFGSEAKKRADKIVASSAGVLLDDLSKANPTGYGKEVLHAMIDKRYSSGAPLLVVSEVDLQTLSDRLGDSLSSRLAGYCKIVSMDGPDRRVNGAG